MTAKQGSENYYQGILIDHLEKHLRRSVQNLSTAQISGVLDLYIHGLGWIECKHVHYFDGRDRMDLLAELRTDQRDFLKACFVSNEWASVVVFITGVTRDVRLWSCDAGWAVRHKSMLFPRRDVMKLGGINEWTLVRDKTVRARNR